MKFKESALVHKYLDEIAKNGHGCELGGSSHNPFGIVNTINIDYTSSMDTIFKNEEFKLCGEKLPVDVVAFADDLPFADSHFDFLINSHLFEHMPNSIRALMEWWRVVKKDGLIISIIPHRDALAADKNLPVTTLEHLWNDYACSKDYENHELPSSDHAKYGHYHIHTLESYTELVNSMNSTLFTLYAGKNSFVHLDIIESIDPDDKVGNGFMIVHKVIK